MGITIKSPNYSIDMGYGGFMRLRRRVASLCNAEIKDFYEELFQEGHHCLTWCEDEWKNYDLRLNSIWRRNEKKFGKVLNFLYQSDCDGKLNYGGCKQILKVLGDYDSDDIFGYAGWGPQAAKFSDFKKILEDCAQTKKSMIWY